MKHDPSKNGPASDANLPSNAAGAKPPIPPPRQNRILPPGPARRAADFRGVWTVEGDQLIKQVLATHRVHFGDQEWTDYDLTFEARKSAGPGSLGALFRVNEEESYIVRVGDGGKHSLELWSKVDDKGTEIRSKPGTIQPFEWYKLKISLRGPRIRIELDDHLLFDVTDEFSQKGRVRLLWRYSAGRFRNIKVSAPDGTVLWEGPPDLPEK